MGRGTCDHRGVLAIAFVTTPGALLNAGTGLALALLGMWVATHRPRRPGQWPFVAFAITFGLGLVPNNLWPGFGQGVWQDWFGASQMPFFAASGIALLGMMWRLPVPAVGQHRRLAWGATIVTAAVGLVAAWSVLADVDEVIAAWGGASVESGPAILLVSMLGIASITLPALLIFVAVLGVRSRWFEAAGQPVHARDAALMALGVSAFGGLQLAAWVVRSVLPVGIQMVAIGCATFAVGAWLYAAWAGQGALRRRAVRVPAVLAVAFTIQTVIIFTGIDVTPGAEGLDVGPQWGIARLAGAAIVGYAIVRHQMLGIDVRIKWTIKQSTVAGIFIAVFFVVSELAAQAFSQTLGTVAGIVAAGALLFALAPLQHFAHRVADHAMPGVRAFDDMELAERERFYAEAAFAAWRDGSLSVDERAMLDHLRSQLGLDDGAAMRIEADAARRASGR